MQPERFQNNNPPALSLQACFQNQEGGSPGLCHAVRRHTCHLRQRATVGFESTPQTIMVFIAEFAEFADCESGNGVLLSPAKVKNHV
jgi:hypothetical protein